MSGAPRTAGGGAPVLLLLACALPHAIRALWPLVEFGDGATLLTLAGAIVTELPAETVLFLKR